MKKIKVSPVYIFVFCIVLIAVCISIGKAKDKKAAIPTPASDPASQYQLTAEQIQATDALAYYIATQQTILWNGQSFSSYCQQRLNMQDPGKDAMRSYMAESTSYGGFSVDLCEYYESGNGYVTVGENTFTAPVSGDAFTQRYAPAVCFDPALYSTVSAALVGSDTIITFTEPKAAEHWALPKDAVFTDASGYALLNNAGTLQESVYTLSYMIGDASVTRTTKIIMVNYCKLNSPDKADAYIALDYFDAPRMLEQACGYLIQAKNIHSISKTDINCQTFSISRTQRSELILSGYGEDLYAQLDTQINQLNQSRGGEVTQLQQKEVFQDGAYSISKNGVSATENTSIDAAAMKKYCQEMLVQDILLPGHIAGVTAQETDTSLTLTFQASEVLAEAICSNICNILYSDPALLHALSSDSSIQSVQCVLSLDKHTGIPLSFSSQYSAHHTIEEISYQLESKTEQTYEYTKNSGHE